MLGFLRLYAPGDLVERTGLYVVVTANGTESRKRVVCHEGEKFPPISAAGLYYVQARS